MSPTELNYKKIAARLKKERRVFISRHPNDLDMLIGTPTYCFCVAPDAQSALAHYWRAEGDIEMEWNDGVWSESRPFQADTLRSFWNKKEALETPKALLSPTRILYEYPHYKAPGDIYRKLFYTGGEATRLIWVDKGLLDVLDADPGALGNTQYWRLELLDNTLVRAKRSHTHFEYGKGSVVTWQTVMYCGRATNITEE
jgi:hypothetical protein